MIATASFKSHTKPEWKYGAVYSIFLKVGALNANSSPSASLTTKRPLSPANNFSYGVSFKPNGW